MKQQQPAGPRRFGLRRLGLALALSAALLTAPGTAVADDYDPARAGHPLRIAGYIAHPVGVILDRLIFRPAHWIGSWGPMRTLFGHTEED